MMVMIGQLPGGFSGQVPAPSGLEGSENKLPARETSNVSMAKLDLPGEGEPGEKC